jgi:hypothetical protein
MNIKKISDSGCWGKYDDICSTPAVKLRPLYLGVTVYLGRLERGGSCNCTTKANLIGLKEYRRKEVLPWLVRWACLAGFFIFLGCSSVHVAAWPSAKHFCPHRTLLQCLCHHHPASWAGSCAARSPVSKCASLHGCTTNTNSPCFN